MYRTFGRAGIMLALTALLVAGCSPVSDGNASHRPGVPLLPDAELNGMRLTTADPTDTAIFDITCDPIILSVGIHARECEVPQLKRLMVGYGNIATSPALLEAEWRTQRWQLYLDGHQVDLAAFGALADRPYVGANIGAGAWIRLWAVTLVDPTPGRHTLRYLRERPAAGDAPADTLDATWTVTVETLRRRP